MAEFSQEGTAIDDDEAHRRSTLTAWDPTHVGTDISILLDYRKTLQSQNVLFEEQVDLYVEKVDAVDGGPPRRGSAEPGRWRGSISPLTECILKEESLHLIVLLGGVNVGKSTFLSLFLRDLWGEITVEKRTCAVVAYSYSKTPRVVVRDFKDSNGNQLAEPDIHVEDNITDINALRAYLFSMSCAPTTNVERLVEVFYPIEALKASITLVDCPGFDENSTVGSSIGHILAEHKVNGDAAATASIIYLCNPDRATFRSADASFVTSICGALMTNRIFVICNKIDGYLRSIEDTPGRDGPLTEQDKHNALSSLQTTFERALAKVKKSWKPMVFYLSAGEELKKLLAFKKAIRNAGGPEHLDIATVQCLLPSADFIRFEKALGTAILTEAKSMLVLEARRLGNEASRMMIHLRCLPDSRGIQMSNDVNVEAVQQQLLLFEGRFIREFNKVCNKQMDQLLTFLRMSILRYETDASSMREYLNGNGYTKNQHDGVQRRIIEDGLRSFIAEEFGLLMDGQLAAWMQTWKKQALDEVLILISSEDSLVVKEKAENFLRRIGAGVSVGNVLLSQPRMAAFFSMSVDNAEVKILIKQATEILETQRRNLRLTVGATAGMLLAVPAVLMFIAAGVMTGGLSIAATVVAATIGSAAMGSTGGFFWDSKKKRAAEPLLLQEDANLINIFKELCYSQRSWFSTETSFLDTLIKNVENNIIQSNKLLADTLKNHITSLFPKARAGITRQEAEDGFDNFGRSFAGISLWCESIASALAMENEETAKFISDLDKNILPGFLAEQAVPDAEGFELRQSYILHQGLFVKLKAVTLADGSNIIRIFWEYTMMKYLQHENILPPMGVLLREDARFTVVGIVLRKKDISLRDAIARNCLSLNQRFMDVYIDDVNPSNILISNIDREAADIGCYLADFDIATPRNLAVSFKGTFGYCAPEVGHSVFDASADVYSFGIVLCVLVKGKEDTSYLSSGGITAALHRDDSLTATMKALLMSMTQIFPKDRPPTAAVLSGLEVMTLRDFFGDDIVERTPDHNESIVSIG